MDDTGKHEFKEIVWIRTVEIGMPLEYRVAIAQLYEQVRGQPKLENGFSKHFLSNMGVITYTF